jgi:HAD superfamily hydrolase (TIGR01509 family)
MTSEATLRPGVERLLTEALAAGIRLAIATTTTRSNVHKLLVRTLGEDAEGWFAAIVAGEDVARKKPAPDVYRVALDKLQLPAAHCVAFEDSFIGLQAAKAAGLFTVVTPTYWTQRDNLSAADWLLPNPSDLPRLDEVHSRHANRVFKALEAA